MDPINRHHCRLRRSIVSDLISISSKTIQRIELSDPSILETSPTLTLRCNHIGFGLFMSFSFVALPLSWLQPQQKKIDVLHLFSIYQNITNPSFFNCFVLLPNCNVIDDCNRQLPRPALIYLIIFISTYECTHLLRSHSFVMRLLVLHQQFCVMNRPFKHPIHPSGSYKNKFPIETLESSWLQLNYPSKPLKPCYVWIETNSSYILSLLCLKKKSKKKQCSKVWHIRVSRILTPYWLNGIHIPFSCLFVLMCQL